MKFILTSLTLLLFFSCATQKHIPLKGRYVEPPYLVKSSKSFEEAWSRMIDMFAYVGLPIKIIDKSSGLLVAGVSAMSVTSETKEGKLKEPNAMIVTELVYDWGRNKYTPITSVTSGEWNIRIKPNGDGCIINVNITNLTYYDSKYQKVMPVQLFKSTGVFEKTLIDFIDGAETQILKQN